MVQKESNEKNSNENKKNPLASIANMSTRHPKKTLLIFIAITILFMIPASKLTIDTSMEGVFGEGEGVPEGVKSFQEIGKEFGEQERVTIVVDCSKSEDIIAEMYLKDLAEVLKNNDWFTEVKYTQNIDFAGEKAVLYLPEENLHFLLDPEITTESAESTYNYIIETMNKPSYFVSENGEIYLLNMILNVTIDSPETRTEIFDGLYDILDDVQNSDSRYKDLEVGFTGSLVVYDYEGDKMALNDIYVSAVITLVLILILLFVSFRSISLPILSLIPLICGVIITAGLTYVIYGALSMMAGIFAVLLLGLGIDFCIHLLTRFTEEMEEHEEINKAFRYASITTGKAIVLGALTTATAFGALAFSKTLGVHQMGVILALGLLVTLVCVFFILPALTTLRLKLKIGKLKEKLHKRARFSILRAIGSFSSRYAVALVLLLVLIGVFFAFKAQEVELSSDLHELEPKTVPAYKQLEKVKANFDYSEDYILCVADSYDELVRSVEGLRTIPNVMEVESILDFLPQNQDAKLAIFEQSKVIHPEFANISWLNVDKMTWRDLPLDIQRNWVSNRERFLIRIKARGNIWDEKYREDLVKQLSEVNPNMAARAIMASELMNAIKEDVIRTAMIAGIPILIIVYIGFRRRNPIHTVLALIPVLFGIGGILALSGYLGISLNMSSIMMIPLVIGIGIDNGIHILHRYKEEGRGSIPMVIQHTGKAIFLTTATTCLAFSSFTIAEHPAMRSLGRVPVLGLILCFLAAVIFLPALIRLILDRTSSKE